MCPLAFLPVKCTYYRLPIYNKTFEASLKKNSTREKEKLSSVKSFVFSWIHQGVIPVAADIKPSGVWLQGLEL